MDYGKVIERVEGVCGEWRFDLKDDGWCHYALFEAWSPAGEDIPLERQFDKEEYPELRYSDIFEWIDEEWREYDVDEHVELWIGGRGRNGVPGTVRELLDDAEAIGEMLHDLRERLGGAR